MLKLKSCPFCGGDAEVIAFDPYDGYQGNCKHYQVFCLLCNARILKTTKDSAIEAWNRRVGDE